MTFGCGSAALRNKHHDRRHRGAASGDLYLRSVTVNQSERKSVSITAYYKGIGGLAKDSE